MHRTTACQNPAPPDFAVVVAGVDPAVVGEFWLCEVLFDPHPAAARPSAATQTMGALRRTTVLRLVALIRVIDLLLLDRSNEGFTAELAANQNPAPPDLGAVVDGAAEDVDAAVVMGLPEGLSTHQSP